MVLTEGNVGQEDRKLTPLEDMTAELQDGVELQYNEVKRLQPITVHVRGNRVKVETWRKAGKHRACISCRIRKREVGCGLRKAEDLEEAGQLHASKQCPAATAYGHLTIWVEGDAMNRHQPILVTAV